MDETDGVVKHRFGYGRAGDLQVYHCRYSIAFLVSLHISPFVRTNGLLKLNLEMVTRTVDFA